MNLDTVKMLYDYNYWAHRKVWDCVMQLSEEQFTRDVGYSWGSVHGQVVHVMSAEWIWFSRLRGTSPKSVFRNEDYPNRAAVRERWDAVEAEVRGYLETLTPQDLERDFTYQRTDGEAHQDGVLPILLHVVNHGTDHRAQILSMIHQLGGPTLEQDLTFYLRDMKVNG